MARFAAAPARRYGPGGTFWRSRPDLPPMPIRAWQVWNEPSLPQYWPTGPNAAEYVRMLRVVGAALKQEDPDADIVTAGLPDSRLGVPFDEYLPAMYEAGAGKAFDTLAVHPYASDAEGSLAAVERARSIARAHSDDSPIWVTEIGWASGGPPSAFTVGEQGQADRISRVVRLLTERRGSLGLRGLVYYNWRDAVPYPPDFKDFFGLHTGLLALDGRPKPALAAFATAIERRRAGAATCREASC
jgi:Glycosyl hydrolase catalytic core